ncbi:hypothetical protein Tco_1147616, partial [Tanacetum coccineum]
MMDDLNITMEEYIRFEEEKSRKRGKVFIWESAKYGKIWYDEDVHDLISVETEFPAVVFNDNLTSNETLSCEPTVSSLNNNEIDFRISFDESNDEDYMVVFDKNSFSYKIISTDDLKTDLKNDNEKVNVSLFPSPKPTISCIDDLDFFKYFENEFPTIVYNDALTSKSDFSTKPTLCPQHIDEFDLKDETSLSEYDEVFIMELNVNVMAWNHLVNGMLFNLIKNLYVPFGIPFDPKRYYKDGDCARMLRRLRAIRYMALSPQDQRHQYLRYEGLQNTDADIVDFETGLARIYRREVHRVQVFDFGGLLDLIAEGLSTRMMMGNNDDQGHSMFTSRAWRWLFDIKGPLVHELILEFFSMFRFGEAVLDLDKARALQFQLGGVKRRMSWREFILALGLHSTKEMQTAGFGLYWIESARWILNMGDLSAYWIGISYVGDFLGTPPSYTLIRDSMLRLCYRLIACSIAGRSQAPEKLTVMDLFYLRGMDVGLVNVPYLLARYLRLFASGSKQGAMISRGQFVARLAEHFGLLTKERLQGLTMIVRDLPVIDMAELVRLQICVELDDTWAWVPARPARQEGDAGGVAEEAPVAPEGGDEDEEMPQAMPPSPRTQGERIARL